MRKIAFNDGWTCRHAGDSGKGKPVTIPHDAMLDEKRTQESLGGINVGWFEGFDYVYEKEFSVPQEYEDFRVVFEFEGVYRNAEVYLNGKRAGFRPYGYTNFYVEANEFLHFGMKNQIQVIARNADQPNSRWYSGAGIYRPVSLYMLPKKHIGINGVKISTVSIHPAVIDVKVETSASGELELEIFEGESLVSGQEPVASVKKSADGNFQMQLEIPDAKLWSTEFPFLYTCRVRFEEDEAEEIFGIRTIEWSAENGFFTPSHFPMRNRIISGLSRGVIVVEAREKSGTFITVDCALEQGRDVFAIPGRVSDELSMGTNNLIREGLAKITLGAEDVLEEYGIKPMAEERKAVTPAELSFEQELIHRLLMAGERTYDELAELTGFDAGMLNSTLTAMEFSGIIKQSVGRLFSL